MFKLSRLLLDNEIDRRTFIKRLTETGISVAGATSLANSFAADSASQSELPDGEDIPASGRIVENMSGGEVMVEFMADWDIPYLFGLAGSEEAGLLDAIVDREDIKYATAIHEGVAMAMADGYSRSTGRTSLVALHSIAGSAYALGMIVGCYRDRVPVVVTVGRQSTDFRGQDGFLEAANLHQLPKEYTQWSWDVMSVDTITHVLRRAFMLAESPPGGPTFVTFSKDLWEQPVKRAEILPRSRSNIEAQVVPPQQHVQQIADRLSSADFPVIYLGNECIREEISEEVASIAEATGALVTTADKVPVIFPNTHPNFAGRYGDDRTIIPNVDAFWSLGGHMFKVPSLPAEPMVPRGATTMHTTLSESDAGQNYPVDIAAIASIKATAAAVLKELSDRKPDSSSVEAKQQRTAEYTRAIRNELDAKAEVEWDNNPISTSRLVIELDRAMASNALVVSEVVTSDSHIRNHIKFDHTVPVDQRRRNHDTSAGILGWGIAAAVGVAIGNPKKQVWALSGDGSFNFSSQALWSASRYNVPIGIVIFNNGQYQANRLTQGFYQGNMVKQNKYIGVSLQHPDIDYAVMASAYDIKGERVDDPNDLADALSRCKAEMQSGRPYLVDVKIEKYFQGKDSEYYDFFSVADMAKR